MILNPYRFSSGGVTPAIFIQSWSQSGAATTSHTAALPASIASGDLLLLTFVGRPTLTGVVSTPSGWTLLNSTDQGTNIRVTRFYRVADGLEGSSVTITTASSTASVSSIAYRIPAGTWDTGQIPEIAVANNVNAAPDCPSLSPSWGATNTYFIADYGARSDADPGASYPYANGQTFIAGLVGGNGGSGSRADAACCWTTSAAGTVNPAAYSLASGSRGWVSSTIGIKVF